MKILICMISVCLTFGCKDNPSISSPEYRSKNVAAAKLVQEKSGDEKLGCHIEEGEWIAKISSGKMSIEIKEDKESDEEAPHEHGAMDFDIETVLKGKKVQDLQWNALHDDDHTIDGVWEVSLEEVSISRDEVFKSKWIPKVMRLEIESKQNQLNWGLLFLNPFTKQYKWCRVKSEVDVHTVENKTDEYHIHFVEHALGEMKSSSDGPKQDKKDPHAGHSH